MLNTDQEYKDQIKQVGKYNLKDTYKWKERATYFQENEYYTDLVEDTHDWNEFWDEEERRIMNGLWVDGFYIPGLYYFYLNYLPIYHKQLNKYEFPDVYDMDYHTFLCLEHAIFLKKHFVVIKKRQAGFTLKFCVPLIRELFFERGSPNYLATYEEAQVLKTWTEVIEPYREHLNTHTAWYREFTPSKPLNWRVAKQVISESGRNITVGRKNILKGLILSKSPSKGVGGCNLKGTLVKMADSSLMKIEDIRVGDFVVGKDGKPKKVLNLFSGISEMYEIHQSKAMSYVVTPNHKLHLYDQRKNKFVDIEAQDFYKLQPFSQTKLNGFKHDPIVYCEDNNLPIDPYFLGAFLGDGNKGKYSIVVNKTKDIEIYNYLKELCAKENLIFKETYRNISRPEYNDDMYDVWFKRNGTNSTSYHQKCRLLGLEIKHIPSIYLTSGIAQRLQLLAGLIDTDGYYNAKRHRYELSIKCDILRKDITKLIEDLGFIVRTHKKTNNGKSSTVYNKKTSIHVLHITGSIHTIPVKIKRKIAPNQPRKNSKGFSKLTINKWGLGEYFGFECEDNLYSLEDGTVTHNSAKWIFADEAGVNPVLSKFIGYVKPMITYGDTTTGTIIVSGAVGELKHLEGGLKEYIQYPEKNGFYAVDNIWDKDNEFSGKKCGFFVPESWSYFGIDRDPTSEFYNQPFIDEHGNSFVERAEEYINKKRAGLIDEGEEADKFDISQKPLTLAECFQYRGDNVFSTDLINPQIAKIEKNEDHGTFVDLYRTQDKVVKHKLLSKYDNKPILEHPIDPKRKDKDGVIQVWEFPPPNRQTYGVYWAGVDIVRDSVSLNSSSLNVIHIYKGSHNLSGEYTEDRIVAKYMSRPKDKMDWYQKAMLLLEWYNAEALVENNVNWFIEESIKIKEQFRLAKAPQWSKDLTPQGTAHLTKPYGVVMTPKLHEKIIDAISAYIKEPIFTSYDENTGEPTVHLGIERIRDLQLLRELINYRPKKEYEKGNYDSLISFGLALLHAKNNEVLGVIPEDTKENVNFNQKNAKLMLRSRFSHTNLKKLSNAYNI